MNAVELFKVSPVVPVVVLDRLDDAVPLADALMAAGINIMEITLRSEVGLSCIETIANERPDMHVGAGTVTDVKQMQTVREAGGRFSFSPGNSAELMTCASEQGITYIPGVATASEVMFAMNGGIEACKLFPAAAVGGVALLKGFAGPFATMQFCPTGGVSLQNVNDYLALDNVRCVGGSWIVPPSLIAEGDFDGITTLCRDALAHISV